MQDTTVQLVACSPDGKETDRINLYTTTHDEDYVFRSYDAVNHEDGSATVNETASPEEGSSILDPKSKLLRKITYHVDGNGKFRAAINEMTYTSPSFSAEGIRRAFHTFLKMESEESFEEVIQGPDFNTMLFDASFSVSNKIEVWVHFYQNNGAQLAELYIIGADKKITDRYVMYKNLSEADFQLVCARDEPGQRHDNAAASSILSGSAKILTEDKTLQITPEGKFREQ